MSIRGEDNFRRCRRTSSTNTRLGKRQEKVHANTHCIKYLGCNKVRAQRKRCWPSLDAVMGASGQKRSWDPAAWPQAVSLLCTHALHGHGQGHGRVIAGLVHLGLLHM